MINEENLKEYLIELTYLILNMGCAHNDERKFFNDKLEEVFRDSK